jgi:hypothetical protein
VSLFALLNPNAVAESVVKHGEAIAAPSSAKLMRPASKAA